MTAEERLGAAGERSDSENSPREREESIDERIFTFGSCSDHTGKQILHSFLFIYHRLIYFKLANHK
jgi:hypothetical protein